MHAERDHLVTVVFPELRQRLEWLGLDFFDVDLRWGVPETGVDGERANPWAYCKRWIDAVEPFFLCILGQRYGWRPGSEEIGGGPDHARYAGLSITEMEIRHAVLSRPLYKRSFFYVRRSPVPPTAPRAVYGQFVDAHEQQLERLKSAITACGRPVRPYTCRWTGQGFDQLDRFGSSVLEDLWSGVLRDERYVPKEAWRRALGREPDGDPLYTDDSRPVPEDVWRRVVSEAKPAPRDPLDAEAEQMAAFAARHLHWFRGRRRELTHLARFVDEDLPPGAARLCVVGAAGGQGKSALLAKFADGLRSSSHLVIAHFVGATERAGDLRSLLDRLIRELDRHGIPRGTDEPPGHDVQSLREHLAARLEGYEGPRRIVLLFDALNQLTSGHDLGWLPRRLGAGVRVIVSCMDSPSPPGSAEAAVLSALRARRPEPRWASLPPLGATDVREIVVGYLREYCKELDDDDITTISRMGQAHNPLYLLVMLHELRTLGGEEMHRKVRGIIEELPARRPDTVSLFDWVLERLEVFGADAVRLWCTYLALGRAGLSGRELSDLLARKLGPTAAQTAPRIERGIRRYLQRRGPQWDFFHAQLREAVVRRYLPEDPRPLHADVAAYFGTRWREPDPHAVAELPHHLIEAGRTGQAVALLTQLPYLAERLSVDASPVGAGDDMRRLTHRLPAGEAPGSFFGVFAQVFLAEQYHLAQSPCDLFAQLYPYLNAAVHAPDNPEQTRTALAQWIHTERQRRRSRPVCWLARHDLPPQHPGAVTLGGAAPGTTACRHAAAVYHIVVTRDGRRAVTGAYDGSLILWDLERGVSLFVLEGHDDWIKALALSPNDRLVCSGDHRGRVTVWGLTPVPQERWAVSESPEEHFGQAAIEACALSPDGETVAYALATGLIRLRALRPGGVTGDYGLTVEYEAVRQRQRAQEGAVRTLGEDAFHPPTKLRFCEGGRLLFYAVPELNRCGLLDVVRLSETWTLAEDMPVTEIELDPEEALVCFGAGDGRVRVRDRRTGAEVFASQAHGERVLQSRFDAASRRLITTTQGEVKVWDLRSGAEVACFCRPWSRLVSAAFVGDGSRVLLGDNDGAVILCPADSSLRVAPAHTKPVAATAVDRSEATGASVSHDGSVALWDMAAGARRRGVALPSGEEGEITACALSPEARRVALGGIAGHLGLWAPDTGELTELGAYDRRIVGLAFGRRGERLAAVDEATAAGVWDLATGREVMHVDCEAAALHAVRLAFGEEFLAVVGEMGRRAPAQGQPEEPDSDHLVQLIRQAFRAPRVPMLALFQIPVARLAHRLVREGIRWLNADGSLFAGPDAGGAAIGVYTVETPIPVAQIPLREAKLVDCQFSRDSLCLCVCYEDALELWSLASQELLAVYRPEGAISSMAYEGAALLAGFTTGAVEIFAVANLAPALVVPDAKLRTLRRAVREQMDFRGWDAVWAQMAAGIASTMVYADGEEFAKMRAAWAWVVEALLRACTGGERAARVWRRCSPREMVLATVDSACDLGSFAMQFVKQLGPRRG